MAANGAVTLHLWSKLQAMSCEPERLSAPEKSPELLLLGHIVDNFEWESGHRSFTTKVPKSEDHQRFHGDKITVKIARNGHNTFSVTYGHNEFVFPDREQVAIEAVYDRVANKARAAVMMVLAESKGLDI